MPDLASAISLSGRAAFVTGGGAGIGRATALEFAAGGASVAVADIDAGAAEAVAAEVSAAGGKALGLACDVSDEDEVEQAVEAAAGAFGRLDILVNNAGLGARVPTTEVPTEAWRRAIAVGVDGAFFCCRAAGRHMIAGRRGGAVVNVASIMGLAGGGLYPNLAYHAAKGALVNMTRALALEWAEAGIRVNAVAPAFARTALTEKLLAEPGMEAAILDATPLKRLVAPEEVAHAIRFLASDAAAMITGHTLPVDGGWLAR